MLSLFFFLLSVCISLFCFSQYVYWFTSVNIIMTLYVLVHQSNSGSQFDIPDRRLLRWITHGKICRFDLIFDSRPLNQANKIVPFYACAVRWFLNQARPWVFKHFTAVLSWHRSYFTFIKRNPAMIASWHRSKWSWHSTVSCYDSNFKIFMKWGPG